MRLSESAKDKILSETQLNAARSSGPGGQNVNKVSTKIELRFPITSSDSLDESQKQRIRSILKNRISKSGELVLTAQSERTQLANRQIVIRKFFDLLEKALTVSKKRIKTKPTKSSNLKRLEKKKIISEKKQMRKPPPL